MPIARTMSMKICLLGDGGVGKTSLIKRFVLDIFDDEYVQTLGTKITKKEMDIPTTKGRVHLKMMIWDIMGQATARNLREVYYRDAKGALIVFDLTNRQSFKNLHEWILSLYNIVSRVPIVIVGNKSDLKNRITVPEAEIRETVSHYNSRYFITSAKTGENVNEAFEALGNEIVKYYLGI